MTLRIIHVTDIHFGCENKAAVAAVHSLITASPPDLLAVTGDVTQYGALREFAAASAWLKSLPGPQLATPGNHDTPYADMWARLTAPFALYARAIGPADCDNVALNGLAGRAMNTSRGIQMRLNWSKGAARREDAEEACRVLAGAPKEAARLVACHHPLMEVTGGPMTGNVRGGEEAARILAEGGVDMILTGHVHTPFAHALPFADGRTYAIGAATLSLRERGAPAGFNEIEVDPECIRVKAMGWTGSHFEAERTWSFDRRIR